MDQTLKTRALTATIFTIVVLLMLYINNYTRVALFFFIGLGASYEYLTIAKRNIIEKILILLGLSVLYCLSLLLELNKEYVFIGAFICCIFYALNSLYLFKGKSFKLLPFSLLVYPGAASIFVIYGLNKGGTITPSLILGTILLIWLSDSCAYLVGRKIGKRKLFEIVSPKKTWEGFYGGGVAAIIGSILISFLLNEISILHWLVIAFLAWIGGTIGDLTQSAIKRKYGVKDSGTILPGHGGFFDRFDSLIYILPFLYLITNYNKII